MKCRMLMVGFLPVILGVTSAAAADRDLAEGEKMYNKECSVCHGILSGAKTGELTPAFVNARPVRLARASASERTMADFQNPLISGVNISHITGNFQSDRAMLPDRVAVVPIYGPTLKGVVGRAAGTHAGYPYSKAFKLKMEGVTWDEAKLDAWIKSSQTMVPGSFMFYSQKNVNMRGDIIDYLKANSP